MNPGSKAVGHPVNVATGEMFADFQDINIPGTYPMRWKRHYSTRLEPSDSDPFGPGWTHSFSAQLKRTGTGYEFRSPSGGVEIFDDPQFRLDAGESILHPGTFSELTKQGLVLRVTRWSPDSGEITRYHFRGAAMDQPQPLASMETPEGQGLEFAWDARGRLAAVRQRLE